MDEKKIEKYTRKFPTMLRQAIQSLSDDTRIALLVAIMEKPRTWEELARLFDMDVTKLNESIAGLQEGGLLTKLPRHDKHGDMEFPYTLSKFGKNLVDKMIDVIDPKR